MEAAIGNGQGCQHHDLLADTTVAKVAVVQSGAAAGARLAAPLMPALRYISRQIQTGIAERYRRADQRGGQSNLG